MKKYISLIIILCFALSICLPQINVSAQADFTRKDAISLFQNSYDLFNLLQNEYTEKPDTVPNIILDDSDVCEISQFGYIEKFKKILKIELADKKYEINTFADLISVAENYYAPDLVDYLTVSAIDGGETICKGDNEKAYARMSDWQPWPMYVDLSYGSFSQNGNRAALEVYSARVDMGLTVYYCKANIEFIKSQNGWRVSGGPMFDLLTLKADYMDFCYKYSYPNNDDTGREEVILNPSTGDASSYTVPALTVAAIISVALPVTLLRKRRRVV